MLVSELIDEALNEVLLGTYRGHFNQLDDAGIDDAQTDVILLHSIRAVGEQAYIEVDNELMYVAPGGVNESSKTLTVIRGVRGTTAAAHDPFAQIAINPRYPRILIMRAMEAEIRSWPDQLYTTTAMTVEVTDSVVDLAAQFARDDIIGVVKVLRQWSESGVTTDRWMRMRDYRFEKDAFDLGSADLFVNPCVTGSNIQIQVAVPFGTDLVLDPGTDLIDDLGIHPGLQEVLKYGACYRLVTGKETRRLFTETEAESRLAADVPATALLTLAGALKRMRDERLGNEIFRLQSRYGLSRV